MCRHCAKRGALTMASHVDHIKAISEGGAPFPGHDGLQALCLPCHSRKTARGGEAGAASTTKPMKGCDADGNPIDPAHPWKSLRAEAHVAPSSLETQLVRGIRRG
ncbi:HNH endonuclease signature motif containing protein [Novosphingobium aureum]